MIDAIIIQQLKKVNVCLWDINTLPDIGSFFVSLIVTDDGSQTHIFFTLCH